jgi:Lon protease-like protein
MSNPFDLSKQLEAFTGRAPLFPLPNVVLFPHLLLPLHIFEPRYREMVGEALGGNRLIAMVLLMPHAIASEMGSPIHATACIGRITADQQSPDGRYDIVLQGLSRARVVREEGLDAPYRVAQLELRTDCEEVISDVCADEWRRRLLQEFRGLYPHHELDRILRRAIDDTIPLGLLSDVLADAMSLDPQVAQQVLAERDVERRCRLVLRLIHEKRHCRSRPARLVSPAQFSLN